MEASKSILFPSLKHVNSLSCRNWLPGRELPTLEPCGIGICSRLLRFAPFSTFSVHSDTTGVFFLLSQLVAVVVYRFFFLYRVSV